MKRFVMWFIYTLCVGAFLGAAVALVSVFVSAAQVPTPQPLPDVLASLVIKDFSMDATGRIEKLTLRAEYYSRTQVPGSPIKPELKGAVEFDLVQLGDRAVILTHADARTGQVVHRHFAAKDAALLLKVIADLQWFEAMPPAASSARPVVSVALPRVSRSVVPPPPPVGLEKVALEMAFRRALRSQPASPDPPVP